MRQTEPQLHPRASYLERGGLASGWMAETTPATPELSGEAAELEKQSSVRSHTALGCVFEICHCPEGSREPLKAQGWEQHKQNYAL